MPAPSRWMIRCSLLYLLAGFTIGALMLTAKAFPAYAQVWMLLPVHIEITIFGWIIQLTMGTAYWILPRFLQGPPRGNTIWPQWMVGILNGGILINVLTYLNVLPQAGTIIGRLLEVTAVILFIMLHWNRMVTHRPKAG